MGGNTKAAVLEGDVECPDLVAFSVYDTNPVNFCPWRLRSWYGTSIKRRYIKRQTKKKVSVQFYCTDI